METLLSRFIRDERGEGVLSIVMFVGIIAVPLVIFLAVFGQDLIAWIREVAPRIFDEGATFLG